MNTQRIAIALLSAFLILFTAGQAFAEDAVRIVINKKVNKLAFIEKGEVVKIFPVATGRASTYTPEGVFQVVKKLVKPTYNKLNIPGGSPHNPLGPRWLGLNARGTTGGTYGIHGTNKPGSIGTYASAGCIRMQNEDVIWLYDRVPMKTTVEIINGPWDLETKYVDLMVNDKTLNFAPGQKPYLSGETIMVPCRTIALELGLNIQWNPELKQGTLSNDVNAISATIGSVAVYHNGEMKIMDTPAVLKNNMFYLPAQTLAEVFGWEMGWDDAKLLLSIKS